MGSLDSSIRSAARATSSAYKRLPIRWRLAGGSAALTLVILFGFATIVGVLTTRRIQSDFNQQVQEAADQLEKQTDIRIVADKNGDPQLRYRGPNLEAYAAAQSAVIRVACSPVKRSALRSPRPEVLIAGAWTAAAEATVGRAIVYITVRPAEAAPVATNVPVGVPAAPAAMSRRSRGSRHG